MTAIVRLSVSLKEALLAQHPTPYLVDVRCSSCGAAFTSHSTATSFSVEVCSNCHPAYTGRERAASSGDRVERFNRRRALAPA
jgi:large subunit ribosomal protein L31